MQPVTDVFTNTIEMLHLMITVQNHLYSFIYIKYIYHIYPIVLISIDQIPWVQSLSFVHHYFHSIYFYCLQTHSHEDCNDDHEDFALLYLPLLAPGFVTPLLLAAVFFCAMWVW